MGVEVKYWPNEHGEMELSLRYDPTDCLLDIDTIEKIYGPGDVVTGKLTVGCELDSETGEVYAYGEHMDAVGDSTPLSPDLVEAEKQASRFGITKRDFFLSLFDSL